MRIQPKPRKCKLKSCTVMFVPFKSTEPYHSLECKITDAIEKGKKQINAELKIKEKEINDKVKKMKEGLMTLSDHEQIARAVFQKWVRLRDKDRPCISCDTTTSEIWDGGHFLKAELYSGLIFHPDNCYKQCRKCNYYLGGNEAGYRVGIIKRRGEDHLKELEESKDKHRGYKYTKEELIEIKNKYQSLIKSLKQNA